MSRYCETKNASLSRMNDSTFVDKLADRHNKYNSETGTIYLNIRYIVLWRDVIHKIDLAKIRDCHRMINEAFSATSSDLDMVPDQPATPWKDRIGNPNIQFLPLDHTKVKTEYVYIDQLLSTNNPVSDGASVGGIVDGVMNVYISDSTSGSILGQAELENNIVYTLYSAVGGSVAPGSMSMYGLGKTLIHEIGHALGLLHTFTDETCDHAKPFPDVPEAIEPNFNATLIEQNGEWFQVGDNRYNDIQTGSTSSCLTIQDQNSQILQEMAINFMDYLPDEYSIMFTEGQATMMREYLTSSDNTTLTLLNSTDKSYSEGIADGTIALVEGSTTVPTDEEETVGDTLTTFQIAMIIIGCIATIGLIIYLVKSYGDGGASVPTKKQSMAYEIYMNNHPLPFDD